MKQKFTFLTVIIPFIFFGQINDTIHLEQVVVADVLLKEFSLGNTTIVLDENATQKNKALLTNLLNYTTPIYFKENGLGMVSSPSFRGTTAQQTAVIWNGININSKLLGQTDFNTVTTNNYSDIQVNPGGGSVIYGSGAIGGSIHLNNKLSFKKLFKNKLLVKYGSFATATTHYKMNYSNTKLTTELAINYMQSDNDYEISEINYVNSNGKYKNYNINFNTSYKYKNNIFSFFSEIYSDERHFSLTSPYQVKTKYHNNNIRSLLQWKNINSPLTSEVSFAYLKEHYKYFEDITAPYSSAGKVHSLIAKYRANYKFSGNKKITFLANNTYSTAKGEGSGIKSPTRNSTNFALLFKQYVTSKWQYEAGLKHEFSKAYTSPFLFSLATQYHFNSLYSVKGSISKNYRLPTFNDLYWQPGGNSTIKPESSMQYQLTQLLQYQSVTLETTAYFNAIKNLITWLPTLQGYWGAFNTNSVHTYGAEIAVLYNKKWNKSKLATQFRYSYTISENKETKKQLIYVPYHKTTVVVTYSYVNFSTFFQNMGVGKVYTQSDTTTALPKYGVINMGVGYSFGKNKLHKINLGIYNLTNSIYENVSGRPMPKRNYNLQLVLSI